MVIQSHGLMALIMDAYLRPDFYYQALIVIAVFSVFSLISAIVWRFDAHKFLQVLFLSLAVPYIFVYFLVIPISRVLYGDGNLIDYFGLIVIYAPHAYPLLLLFIVFIIEIWLDKVFIRDSGKLAISLFFHALGLVALTSV